MNNNDKKNIKNKIGKKLFAFIVGLFFIAGFMLLLAFALYQNNTVPQAYTAIIILAIAFLLFDLTFVYGLILLEKIIATNFVPELMKGDLLTKEESEVYHNNTIPNNNIVSNNEDSDIETINEGTVGR